MPMRAAIIGGGWIAELHVPAIDAAPEIELVAACDTELGRAQAIAGPRNARAYSRWEEMLEREQLDALWVCTPPLAHRAPAVAALARGIHVYLEKPIARTREDGVALVEAAADSSAVCAVGYQWHASELLDVARTVLDGRQIGMLVARNYGPVAARRWFLERRAGGGQILERGSHHIDLQRVLAGQIEAVEAVPGVTRLSGDRGGVDHPGDVEDALMLTFHFTSGALGSVAVAWTADGQPELYALDVLATDATLWLELGPERFAVHGVAAGRRVAAGASDPFDRSVARFIAAARSGDRGDVFCAPEDAMRTLDVALACERALEHGRRVAVTST